MSAPHPDRWWAAVDAASLFAVPPFPGSKPALLTSADASAAYTGADIAQCVDAMRQRQVGGTVWAAQPAFNAGRIVARPGGAAQYRIMAARAVEERKNVLFWFPDARAAEASGVAEADAIVGSCDSWYVLAAASELWADSNDEVALISAIAGRAQRCFTSGEAIDPVTVLAALLAGTRFQDPFSGATVAPLAAVELLGFWRDLIDANRVIGSIYGVAFWKREAVAPLLWDGGTTDRFRTAPEPADTRAAAAWIARTPPAILSSLEQAGTPIHQIEDGFIRSVGLGADCVPPLSIVIDPHGAHYDPAQPSALETVLQNEALAPDMIDRARRLRELIVAQGISKYAHGTQKLARLGGDRRHLLVTGQVEDDQSVLKGGGGITSNLELLRRVRAREPGAFITYRPHPDVDAGHRKGHIDDDAVLAIADIIARDVGITSLIDAADQVHVLTSLAGFEALMRGKPVTTHGVPFYAGWGLTEDLGLVPARRTARHTLDELVAATLLLYPRYLDPITGLPCPPEVLVGRIAAGVRHQNGLLVAGRRLVGKIMRQVRRLPGARP